MIKYFVDKDRNLLVAINPSHVSHARESNDSGTVIVMVNDREIIIDEDILVVVARLNERD